jgi:hypothetical protein
MPWPSQFCFLHYDSEFFFLFSYLLPCTPPISSRLWDGWNEWRLGQLKKLNPWSIIILLLSTTTYMQWSARWHLQRHGRNKRVPPGSNNGNFFVWWCCIFFSNARHNLEKTIVRSGLHRTAWHGLTSSWRSCNCGRHGVIRYWVMYSILGSTCVPHGRVRPVWFP